MFFFGVSCLTVFHHKSCTVQYSSLTRMHAVEYTQKNLCLKKEIVRKFVL